MNLIDRIMAALGWPPPAVHVPTRERRRIRATCEWCGKDIAVIASTGKLWKHDCTQNAPIDEGDPNHTDQHDTWEEHRGER